MVDIYEDCERLTREMVAIPSVNGSSGEKDIGIYIEKFFRNLPYFNEHPENLVIQELSGDALGRRNILAILEGSVGNSKKTMILHGHTDTVGVEDYGILKEACFDPDELEKRLGEAPISEEVRKDLESGLYMFGRGAVDMKSGDAVLMAIAERLSERLEEINGNLIFAFNPVEENMHTGMIESLDILLKLQKERDYEYLFAINTDYTCPLYMGDTHNYVYTGAVGKLLPSFYILGKSTHVGQCLEGFDASMVAARLVDKINLNTDFCDGYDDEYSLPPSVLKMTDLKDFYNVQTAQETFVYFNYFVHDNNIRDISEKLMKTARDAILEVRGKITESAAKYYKMAGIKSDIPEYEPQVYDYRTIHTLAKEKYSGNLERLITVELSKIEKTTTDIREKMMYIVKTLCQIAGISAPAIVFFYTPPYCPHNTLHQEIPREHELVKAVKEILKSMEEEENIDYKMLHFYPSLSDSSYLKIDDPKDSVEELVSNFPRMEELYPIPVDKIQSLDIPAFTFGTYGKDAHKWTERVHKPYTFGVLPKLIEKTIRYYLEA